MGEKEGGPGTPRFDLLAASVEGRNLVVDNKTVIPGPSIGTNATGQESEGQHCIGTVDKE